MLVGMLSFSRYFLWCLVTRPSHDITMGIIVVLVALSCNLRSSARVVYFLAFSISTFTSVSAFVIPTLIIMISLFALSWINISGLLWDMAECVAMCLSALIVAFWFCSTGKEDISILHFTP